MATGLVKGFRFRVLSLGLGRSGSSQSNACHMSLMANPHKEKTRVLPEYSLYVLANQVVVE